MGGQEQPVPLPGVKANALLGADSADGGQGVGRLQRLGEGGGGEMNRHVCPKWSPEPASPLLFLSILFSSVQSLSHV